MKRLLVAAAVLAVTVALAATRVADIQGSPSQPSSSNAKAFFGFDGGVYTAAFASLSGEELYALDFGSNSARLVCDIAPGDEGDLLYSRLQVVNGRMIFSAFEQSTGYELWSSDGTANGTQLLADISPGPSNGMYTGSFGAPAFLAAGNELFFYARDDGGQPRLWKTDGTTTGTQELAPAGPFQFTTIGPPTLAYVNGRVVFSGRDSTGGGELWSYENGQTAPLADLVPGSANSYPTYSAVAGNRLFFTADSTSGKRAVYVLEPDAGIRVHIPDAGVLRYLSTAFGQAFMQQDSPSSGNPSLWRWDGTSANATQVVFQTLPAPSLSEMVTVGGNAFWSGFKPTTPGETELYVLSSATAQARTLDVSGAGVSSNPRSLTPLGNLLYFIAETTGGRSIFRSDGGSTESLAFVTGTAFPQAANLGAANGKLYFADNVPGQGYEMRSYDGLSIASLDLQKDIASSDIQYLTPHLNGACFQAFNSAFGSELWCAPASGGATRMTDLFPSTNSAQPQNLFSVGSDLLFSANSLNEGTELRRLLSDGGLVTYDLETLGSSSSSPMGFALLAPRTVIFTASTAAEGRELFRMDLDSDAGPIMLPELTAPDSVYPVALAAFNGRVYFPGRTGSDFELWSTDGTGPGTQLVKELNPGPQGSTPRNFLVGRERLYFRAEVPDGGTSFWETDGTAAGTRDLLAAPIIGAPQGGDTSKLLAAFKNGALLFVKEPSGKRAIHFTSPDAGMVELARITSNFPEAAVIGELAVFTGNDPQAGDEPWVTDGTPQGTHRIVDLRLGPAGSAPNALLAVGAAVYFNASTNASGPELYRTDGTATGTVLVDELVPGPAGGNPRSLVRSGGRLFFVASDVNGDRELYERALESTPPVITPTITGTLGQNGFYTSDVTVSFTVTDNESAVAKTDCRGGLVNQDTRTASFFCGAESEGGGAQLTVTLARDATPPVLTCPANITQEATSPAGADVAFTIPVTDAITLAPVFSQSANPGVFPVGRTHVEATATDEAGNIGSCGFDVDVVDTTPPTVDCPSNVAVTATAYEGAIVGFEAPTATDVVSGAPDVTLSHQSGGTFKPGKTTVHAEATDSAGNVGSCEFDVTVEACADCKRPTVSPYSYGCGCSGVGGVELFGLLALCGFALSRLRKHRSP